MKKWLTAILFLTVPFLITAQNSADQTAADFLRTSNNLYVVITILITIFAGIIVFLVLQEKKLSKLEKQLKDKQQ